jgi:hypothetical protein
MNRTVKVLVGAVAFALCLGCRRAETIIDLTGAAPDRADGYWHVSWSLTRPPMNMPVTCAEARAARLMISLSPPGGATTTTYRAPCDLAAAEAWIPVRKGTWTVRADLVDSHDARLSAISSLTLPVASDREILNTPFLFKLR